LTIMFQAIIRMLRLTWLNLSEVYGEYFGGRQKPMFKSDHSNQNCITIKMKTLPKIFFYCRILYWGVSVFQVDLSIFQENPSDKVRIFEILRKSTDLEKFLNKIFFQFFLEKNLSETWKKASKSFSQSYIQIFVFDNLWLNWREF